MLYSDNILFLPDIHFPWPHRKGILRARRWADKHKPDLVIQAGDLIDAKTWSKYSKDPDDLSPSHEWDETIRGLEWFAKLFPELHILNGNHDLRLQYAASEARLPSQMMLKFNEMFPYDGWHWHLDPHDKLIVNTPKGKVLFVHGDEDGGRPIEKAAIIGMHVVQGHTHQFSIQGREALGKYVYGAEAGHLMDVRSKAARYSARKAKGSCCGFLVIQDGVPAWHHVED